MVVHPDYPVKPAYLVFSLFFLCFLAGFPLDFHKGRVSPQFRSHDLMDLMDVVGIHSFSYFL